MMMVVEMRDMKMEIQMMIMTHFCVQNKNRVFFYGIEKENNILVIRKQERKAKDQKKTLLLCMFSDDL